MRRRRWSLGIIAAIGVGLAVAPIGFRMFERAPRGGDMLDGFAPYMSSEEIGSFRAHLAEIDAAHDEIAPVLAPGGADLPASRAFVERWAGIDGDMGSMLDDMEANLGEYEGVASLPPFALFPWFFVAPGVLLVAAAAWAWRRPDRGGPRVALALLAVGLLAAPAVFQMFTRAPGGARMIEDFSSMMTQEEVVRVQGYFLTLGSAEGELRNVLLPAAAPGTHPAVESLVDGWPATSADMAPMIGAMVDNLENYRAVAALPPFWLFPWFFATPGLVVLGLVAAAGRTRRPGAEEPAVPTGPRVLEGALS
jgi:hypothetical protein